MKSLFLVQKDQKIILDSYYEALCQELGDCELRRLSSEEQSDLKKYFEDIDIWDYERIILMLRTKAELKQLSFLRTLPNLVILEHDACQNYIDNSKYKGEFSRYYSVVPWAKVLVSGAQVCENLQNEGFDAHFVSKGYDSDELKNLEQERDIELGFIGSTQSQVYIERQDFLNDLVKNHNLQIIKTSPGKDYCEGLNRIKFFISADIGLKENMVKNFEAMACGCLLFIYNQGEKENKALGFKDMENVVLYSNKKELLRKVAQLKEDIELSQSMVKAGQKLVEESFTWRAIAKKAVKKIKLPQRPFKANNNDSFANILGNLSSFWLQQTYGRRLSLLLILALVPRFLGWFQQAYITRDAYLYLSLAQSCAEGNWEEATRLLPWMPPLYPLVLSIPIRIGITPEHGAVFISMLGSIIVLFCIYSIAQKIFKSRHIAELCLLLAAVNRLMVETSYAIGREALYIPLLMISLNLIVLAFYNEPKKGKASKRQLLVYLGALFGGLAYCVRQEGGEVLLALALFCLLNIKWNRFLFWQLLKKFPVIILLFFLPSLVLFQFCNKEIGSKWDPLNTERTKLFIKHLKGER